MKPEGIYVSKSPDVLEVDDSDDLKVLSALLWN